MTRQQQSFFKFRRPAFLNKTKVKLFIRAIDLIADNRMPERSEMHSNLVRSPGKRHCANQAEFFVP